MSTQNLASTEKRLIRIFMMGIFLFLVVFEAIFLMSRDVLEERTQRGSFLAETERMIGMDRNDSDIPNAGPRRPGNIGFIVLGSSGQVIGSRIAGRDVKNVSEVLESNLIENLSTGTIANEQGLFLRKVQIENGNTILFVAPANYDNEELMRDILRFLLLDLIILIPFYFMARVYVRETLEPVRDNLDTMTHFVHDAGHELKTPLAIISGNLQLLRDSKKPDMTLVDESIATVESMTDSIQWLLELADLKLPDKKNKVSLKWLVDREIEILSWSYDTITVQNNIPQKTIANASEKHLSILIRNLLENAMKYNKKDGTANISFEKNTLTITDTGIGIAPEEKDRIFDRFYRANAGGGKSGSGIGLTLVDRITKLYGWKISVESEVGIGTKISVKM